MTSIAVPGPAPLRVRLPAPGKQYEDQSTTAPLQSAQPPASPLFSAGLPTRSPSVEHWQNQSPSPAATALALNPLPQAIPHRQFQLPRRLYHFFPNTFPKTLPPPPHFPQTSLP